jgi:ankyrin repeat protein/Flp pilus assembly protein TadD
MEFQMIKITSRARSLFMLGLAISLCGSAALTRAQQGSGAGGGTIVGAGAVMKLPAKKVTRTTPSSSKPRPGTRKPTVDNSGQLEDALSLADDARQAERWEAAQRGYQLAAKLAPTDPRPHLGLGHVYYIQKKYAEAEQSYARAASLSRGDSEPYARLAFTYTELQRLDEALAAARKSVAAQPDNYYGYLALGYVLSLRRSYMDAEAAYRKSVLLAPQPLIVLQRELVRILSEQRRYADAAKEAKKGIEITPQDYSARFSYALMLQKLGQLVPSAEQYFEAIKLNPKDGAPHSNIGLIYYMTENFAEAREHWTAAVNLGSTYAPDRIGLLIFDGRLTEARTQLEEYTQKSGDDEDGWLMLGDVYRALGDDSRARVTDARAAQIAPEYVGLRRPDLRKLARRGSSPGNNSRAAADSEVLKVDEQGRTTLMLAAGKGRADLIPGIVAAGVDVNARDKDGDASLYYAATNGSLEAVDALLRAGANVNAANKKGLTALIGSATEGYAPVVKLLLAKGARVDQGDQDGDNALILTSALGKTEVMDALLKGRANIDAQNKNGITPLMIASFQGHAAAVRLLIARGANLNARSKNGATALTLATTKSHAEVVEILTNAGARK